MNFHVNFGSKVFVHALIKINKQKMSNRKRNFHELVKNEKEFIENSTKDSNDSNTFLSKNQKLKGLKAYHHLIQRKIENDRGMIEQELLRQSKLRRFGQKRGTFVFRELCILGGTVLVIILARFYLLAELEYF